jgi:hypothetical protein
MPGSEPTNAVMLWFGLRSLGAEAGAEDLWDSLQCFRNGHYYREENPVLGRCSAKQLLCIQALF